MRFHQMLREGEGRSRRSGVTLMLVLACLVVVVLVGMSLLQASVQRHRQARRESQRLQAFWLAESGVLRAAARLRQEPDYAGETWRVSPAELEGEAGGVVVIRVERDADSAAGERTVTVEARYPEKADRGVLQQRRVILNSTNSTNSTDPTNSTDSTNSTTSTVHPTNNSKGSS